MQAQCKVSGETVVLKVYKLGEQCDLQRVQLYREIRVHSQLQHSNVVQFYAGFLVGAWVGGWVLLGRWLAGWLGESRVVVCGWLAGLVVGGWLGV